MTFLEFLNDIRRRAGLPIEEGMDDGSFMLSRVDAKDDGLPSKYPLPTDAKKYEKDKKGFRGKKPKVRQLVKVKNGS